jgi:DNA processing protein
VLTSAADLVYILNWDIQKESKPVQKQLFVTLDDDEQKVYDYLLKTGKELMDIALRCEFPIYKISGMLLNMELKGVIRPCLENYLRLFNFNMFIKALYK